MASLIGSNHKVDLTKPEKVIIVEIYQVITLTSNDQISVSTMEIAIQRHRLFMAVHSSSYLFLSILTHFGVRQTICGMSVVEADWENLKRYNLAEIYQQTSKPLADINTKPEAQARPRRVSKDEA